MIVDIVLILAGLVLLVLGGDQLVKGAVNLSLRLGIAPVVVGLTVVAFGTSAPELLVSVSAALQGASDIALGNVVGSNIANIMLILGATAVMSAIDTKTHDLRESGVMMIGASLLLVLLAVTGAIGKIEGIVLLVALAFVLWRQLSTARPAAGEVEGVDREATGRKITVWLLVGLVALPIGAQLLVSGASDIARLMGISEAVIGLTLVAIGTSLPEMAASLAAAAKGRGDIALGNVVGSNIFNILAILGLTGLIAPLPVPEQMLRFDLWVMLASALLLLLFLYRGLTITRMMGGGFMIAYAVYLWVLL